MAFVFDATPSGASANSWASVGDADDYFAGRRNALAWTALATTEKEIALVTATRTLERLRFRGWLVTNTQRLQVPRGALYDADGRTLPTNVVPPVFKEAVFEQVLFDLNQGATDATQPSGLELFEKLEMPGAVSLTMRDGAQRAVYASAALALLADYVTGAPGTIYLERA